MKNTLGKSYRLINLNDFLFEISKFMTCCICGSKAVLKEKALYGLVSEFYVEYGSCRTRFSFKSSSVFESSNHDYEVNTRIIILFVQ